MRIALVAMSGIRCHDRRLLELGLTFPGVVERSQVIAALPSLGLLYLAACTPPQHEIAYFEIQELAQAPEALAGFDLVAISSFTAQIGEAYVLADRLRAVGVRVAVGGLHASVRPEEAARHADYVVVGEGENAWPRVVRSAEAGEAGRIFRAGDLPPVDVDRLPVPRYDLLAGRPYTRFPVQTSRGCPWRCEFCASSVMLTQKYRVRPVADVLRDIEAVRQVDPQPFIEFADDNTFAHHAWGRALCRALEPLALEWFAETDISIADDPELPAAMRRAGCRQVLIGLESPEPPSLSGLELRADFKSRHAGRQLDCVRRIQDAGVTVNGCFILGLDGQTPDVFGRIEEFADAASLYDVQITVLTPFPGTPLYDRLLREGRILEPERWDLCTLFDVNYVPQQMTPDQLRAGLHHLAERLYADHAVQARRKRFFRNLRPKKAEA